jgi:hypothetical protein
MAQSNANNLQVGIVADSTKAVREIGLVKAALTDLRSEHRKLAQEIQRGGGDPARYEAVSRQILTAETSLKKLTATQREHQTVNKEGADSLKQLSLEFAHLAHAVGLPIEGVKALRFGLIAFGAAAIIRGIKAVSNSISELVELSRETRFDPRTIQVFTDAVGRAGGNVEKAKSALQSFGEELLNQQKKTEQARKVFSQVLAQPGTTQDQATAAMNKALQQIDDGLAEAGIYADRFTRSTAGMRQGLAIAAQYVLNLNRQSSILADLWSREHFKQPFAEIAEGLEAAAQNSTGLIEKQLGIKEATDQQIAADKQYKAALYEVGDAYDYLTRRAAIMVADSIKGWGQLLQLAGMYWFYLTHPGPYAEPTEATAARMPGGADYAAPTAATAARMGGQAAGGYIRGPGSGTSDSIAAWLSNGEYVVNAGSVRRLGVGLLDGLNSFAKGGLVGVPPIRFAEGGLASSATTPVHLHLGGHVFATSASGGVASALIVEAKRHQMTSGGTKPSWYGR